MLTFCSVRLTVNAKAVQIGTLGSEQFFLVAGQTYNDLIGSFTITQFKGCLFVAFRFQ